MDHEPARDTCCNPKRYNKVDTFRANPFDDRLMPFQKNEWCSNELILRDPAMRCQAMIQPLDMGLKSGTQVAHQHNLKAGFQ